MYDMGVRSSLLLNKFDNPLTGVRFDGGLVGILINGGNHQSAGAFWSAQTCAGKLHDNEIDTVAPAEGSAALDSLLATLGVTRGTVPTYPPAPHCNTRGLTELGRHVVRRMMDRHMIVNPDHMSQAGVDDTLTLLESRDYPGVISPHGWMDPGNWPRIWKLGGMAFPGHSQAQEYVKEWREYRPKSTPYKFGWGYGADLGGLSHQPEVGPTELKYPFRSFDGRVSFDRQRTGDRTFDYTKEGVAHYGLYADWFEDLRRIGGNQLARDMWDGAEAYLEMWERAHGIQSPGCASVANGALSARGRFALRLGESWEALLRAAGQPQQRTRAWSWCVRGKRNSGAADVADLTTAGRVQLVGSTARGRSAGGVFVGQRAGRAVRLSRSVGRGIRVRKVRRSVWVYAVRGGRVRAVAVATRTLARQPGELRRAMTRLVRAKVTQARPTYQPGKAEAASVGRLAGRILAGTSDTRLNAAFALLCGLPSRG
jgi:hypothetical protein